MKCRGPVNRLLMMRGRNLCGPVVQNVGNGVCAKSVGAFYAANGPGGHGIPPGQHNVIHNADNVIHGTDNVIHTQVE